MSAPLLQLSAPPVQQRGVALLQKGFRPFFLVAAAHAALFVPAWLLLIDGAPIPRALHDAMTWHAHEMLFGFTTAVLAGFLLTAASNWTGRVTAVGGRLVALVVLFLAGRVAMLSPSLPPVAVAAIDLPFLPLLALALARPIFAARSSRNYVFPLLLIGLACANAMVHADVIGWLPGWRYAGQAVAIDLLAVVVLIVAARIIPGFTRNATGDKSIRSMPWLDRAVVALAIALAVLDALRASLPLIAPIALVTGLLVLARSAGWGLRGALREPMLAILHVGHTWIAVGLVLRSATAYLDVIPASAATHALAVGGIGSLTIGMMARVALGHTGRPIHASRSTIAAFAMVTLAAFARVTAALLGSSGSHLVTVAGVLFASAFAVYLVAYARPLTMARVDGKPG